MGFQKNNVENYRKIDLASIVFEIKVFMQSDRKKRSRNILNKLENPMVSRCKNELLIRKHLVSELISCCCLLLINYEFISYLTLTFLYLDNK